MPNIDAMRLKAESKGNGGDKFVAHHKMLILGRPTERTLDGCYKHPTCDNCPEDISDCHGNYKKEK